MSTENTYGYGYTVEIPCISYQKPLNSNIDVAFCT